MISSLRASRSQDIYRGKASDSLCLQLGLTIENDGPYQ